VVRKEELYKAIYYDFYNDPRSLTLKYEILDCLDVSEHFLSGGDARFFAAHGLGRIYQRQNPGLKIALVCADPAIIKNLQEYIDLFKGKSSSWSLSMFQTLEDARAWIFYSLDNPELLAS